MRDFTLEMFKLLLTTLKEQQYTFQTFADFLKNPQPRAVILRHDVDARKFNSLRTARLENEIGIVGTYNFRMVPQSYDERVIREIASMGHEIGYHYEELAIVQGNFERAIKLFENNLSDLRQIAKVETICMHGSPLSRYDNRKLWEKYKYREFGIIGEPYFDLDFSKILYLTDTGRRWDGERVSVRDRMTQKNSKSGIVEESKSGRVEMGEAFISKLSKRSDIPLIRSQGHDIEIFHSTFEISSAIKKGYLPNQIMINVHPQRWDDRIYHWIRELFLQNLKNQVKRLIVREK